MDIQTKRVYEPATKDDGFRVLVDRLWPRGVTKAEARLDLWAKDVAPSTDLRNWFAHEPQRFDEFAQRYEAELGGNQDATKSLVAAAGGERITLIYAAKDPVVNHAAVLMQYLQRA